MTETARTPARADINADFPLRGQVVCASCGGKLTGGYARSKTGKKHGYYNCYQKGCPEFRKGIRKDQLESEFETMLTQVQPSQSTYGTLKHMLADLWDELGSQTQAQRKTFRNEIRSLEKKIDALLERLVEANSDALVKACSKKVDELESQKALLAEKEQKLGQKKGTFGAFYELACRFIENPIKLWDSGHLEWRHTVLSLCFGAPPEYARNQGFTNPIFSLPFKVLTALEGGKNINGGESESVFEL